MHSWYMVFSDDEISFKFLLKTLLQHNWMCYLWIACSGTVANLLRKLKLDTI